MKISSLFTGYGGLGLVVEATKWFEGKISVTYEEKP